jgi:hypothetical protein
MYKAVIGIFARISRSSEIRSFCKVGEEMILIKNTRTVKELMKIKVIMHMTTSIIRSVCNVISTQEKNRIVAPIKE